MRVRINGVEEEVATATLAELLAARAIAPRAVVVALNRDCVLRSRLADTPIAEGDEIEILAPMQGG